MSKIKETKFKNGEAVLLPDGKKVTVVATWFDGEQWRCEVTGRSGVWIFLESSLIKIKEKEKK